MKMFSHLKLIKELKLLFTFGVIILLYCALPDYLRTLFVQAQLQQQQQQQQPSPMLSIKITSPMTGQQVLAGELTISGTSTDSATTDCTVYLDWNNTKPFQTATATGPAGVNDYSTWQFTYTNNYHLITNGTNNLTSKLSCVDNSTVDSTANVTKSYSVNVIGVTTTTSTNNTAGVTSTSEEVQQQESPIIDSNITTIMEDIKNVTTTSPESTPSIPTSPSVPLSPSIKEQQEPSPALKPEDDQDSSIYWDIK